MDEILDMLIVIRRDLDQIKRRLSIKDPALDQDQDHDKRSDLDIDQFKQDCLDFEIDLDGVDFNLISRSISYYLGNKWRIKNPKAYLTKIMAQFKGPRGGEKKEQRFTVLGYDYATLEGYFDALDDALVDRVFDSDPELERNLGLRRGFFTMSKKRQIIASALKKGFIK